jgi:hypothetical protein
MKIQDRTIIVTAVEARRAANKFLAMEVGMAFSATDPIFIPMAEPVWQFSIRFRLPRLGTLATLGTIDVNANTRTVLPLSKTRIREIQKRANALVEHTPSVTAA